MSTKQRTEKYEYLSGFGNHHSTESIKDTLPKGQNSPQQCPKGLYAEQLSGTAFTAPRSENERRYVSIRSRGFLILELTIYSWLYRIRPAVMHKPYREISNGKVINDFTNSKPNPNQFRWMPYDIPDEPVDFIDGMILIL